MALSLNRMRLLGEGVDDGPVPEETCSNVGSYSESAVGSMHDMRDGASSGVNSLVNSKHGSMAASDSKNSRGVTEGKISAFTAPPRYRNSGAFVHGTKFRNFNSIMEIGLKAAKSEIFMIDEVRPDGRVPGLRTPPEILIFIDENKARSEHMEFEYNAAQGTWKTTGINGVIRPWFFQKVVDQRSGPGKGNVLFQSKEDPMMLANQIRTSHMPPYLIHATYWENVNSILNEGLVPAKNPSSSLRQPFKDLLRGAENHVYTVSSQGLRAPRYQARSLLSALAEPEVVPEDDELAYKISKDLVGLEQAPDALFVIDAKKASELGVQLSLVQSADREETVFVEGHVPPQLLTRIEPNDPLDLPDNLKAKIVDPKSFEEIPIIDLSIADEEKLVEQLRYACEVVGFMQVVGHGVSEELQQQHMDMQRRFFELSDAVKAKLILDAKSPVRGYFGKGGEDLDEVLGNKVDEDAKGTKIQKSRKDNKEALDTNGVPWSKPVGGDVARVFGMPSRLPDEEVLPGFQEVLEAYAGEMFGLCRRLLELMALVLDLPRDFFEQHLTAPVATHRLLHYWPLKDLQTEIGVGQHSDYGLLTVLKQDGVGGLQVLNAKDSRWVHCCPIDNAFVVNLGDMMERWTGNRFKSTIHRVVNLSPKERYSVPYFLEPNMDTIIVPGGLCQPTAALETDAKSLHRRRCQLRQHWMQQRNMGGPASSEEILERFYRASGQLKDIEAAASPSAGRRRRPPQRKRRS